MRKYGYRTHGPYRYRNFCYALNKLVLDDKAVIHDPHTGYRLNLKGMYLAYVIQKHDEQAGSFF